jgi:asparaginyl-tRNA synthetase
MPGFEEAITCQKDSSFKAYGRLVRTGGDASKQVIEMLLDDKNQHILQVCGKVQDKAYPLAKKFHTVEHLRTVAHLRPRSNLIGCVTRVRNSLAFATHIFFQTNGFLYIHTPLITTSDCEGAGEMFQVTTLLNAAGKVADIPKADKAGTTIDYSKDFFSKPAYLTVSGQLSVEDFACSLANVYTFGPTFRAENSNTTRHLAEFWVSCQLLQ